MTETQQLLYELKSLKDLLLPKEKKATESFDERVEAYRKKRKLNHLRRSLNK